MSNVDDTFVEKLLRKEGALIVNAVRAGVSQYRLMGMLTDMRNRLIRAGVIDTGNK